MSNRSLSETSAMVLEGSLRGRISLRQEEQFPHGEGFVKPNHFSSWAGMQALLVAIRWTSSSRISALSNCS